MDDARSALASRLGVRPLHRILGGGYTLMEHWLVELEDGTPAFAKVAVDEPTAGFLRDEHRVYSQVEGSFLPAFLGWDDDGERPILLVEDLSEAHWLRLGVRATSRRCSPRSTRSTPPRLRLGSGA
jgi:hypothetical protein